MRFTLRLRQTNINVMLCPSSPRCSVLANIPGTDFYRDRKDYLHVNILNHTVSYNVVALLVLVM